MPRASALVSVVLLVLTCPRAFAQDAWNTVRFPVGQFSVELPAKPDINKSRDRDGPGTAVAAHNEKMQGGDCWVRLERKGSRILGSISFDGKTWKELKPIQTVWPAKLKVGVSATSSSNQPFSVVFEELEIKGKEKKGLQEAIAW